MKVITQKWLNFAQTDIETCEALLNNDNLTNIIAFHSQQSVEKCFKAIIEEAGGNLPHIHDLTRLFNFVEKHINFEIDMLMLNILDSIYTASRYPGEIGVLPNGNPNITEVLEMLEFAKYIYEKSLKLINKNIE